VLESLATQFGPVLVQFFERRVRDRHEAEDLTQEVFVRLLRRRRVDEVQNMRGYLFECAANTLNDRLRADRSRRRTHHESFDAELHGRKDFPIDHVLIQAETLSRATRALLELPDRMRTIFVLRRFEGMQNEDIAHRLGVSLSLVEKEMARALAHLVRRVGEE